MPYILMSKEIFFTLTETFEEECRNKDEYCNNTVELLLRHHTEKSPTNNRPLTFPNLYISLHMTLSIKMQIVPIICLYDYKYH